jgi:hypothetical protein
MLAVIAAQIAVLSLLKYEKPVICTGFATENNIS